MWLENRKRNKSIIDWLFRLHQWWAGKLPCLLEFYVQVNKLQFYLVISCHLCKDWLKTSLHLLVENIFVAPPCQIILCATSLYSTSSQILCFSLVTDFQDLFSFILFENLKTYSWYPMVGTKIEEIGKKTIQPTNRHEGT